MNIKPYSLGCKKDPRDLRDIPMGLVLPAILVPKLSEELQGGHAVCIVGYDDTKGLFRFKNSWGAKWGNKGYGALPYDYMKKYCSDAWSGTDLIENPKALVKKREELLKRFA